MSRDQTNYLGRVDRAGKEENFPRKDTSLISSFPFSANTKKSSWITAATNNNSGVASHYPHTIFSYTQHPVYATYPLYSTMKLAYAIIGATLLAGSAAAFSRRSAPAIIRTRVTRASTTLAMVSPSEFAKSEIASNDVSEILFLSSSCLHSSCFMIRPITHTLLRW